MMTEQEKAEYRRGWRKRNPEKVSAWHRRWVEKNKELHRATQKKWWEANKERLKESIARSRKAWRERNAAKEIECKRRWSKNNRAVINSWRARNKEKVASYARKYQTANRAKGAAIAARYLAQKLSATPRWANHFFIEEIYDLARRRTDCLGVKHHVDHIVPLQSKIVCGLHCEANLRVIPATTNIRKGNREWPDMPEPIRNDGR